MDNEVAELRAKNERLEREIHDMIASLRQDIKEQSRMIKELKNGTEHKGDQKN